MSFENRNSTMPDVSPKLREGFSTRDRTIAIMLVAAIIAALALGFGSLDTYYRQKLDAAIKNAQQKESEFLLAADKVEARAQELTQQEKLLIARETALKEAESTLTTDRETLATDRQCLEVERTAFHNRYAHVLELAKALVAELDEDSDLNQLIVEDIDDFVPADSSAPTDE